VTRVRAPAHRRSPEVVPVFPLPNAVLFPGTVLPLHVFEPRYRTMVEDAADGARKIAIALLRSGWESDYEGSPPIHLVGTVGRIDNLRRETDGRFYLDLVGTARVDLKEIGSDHPYRIAEATPRPEAEADENEPLIQQSKLDVLAAHGCLVRELARDRGPHIVMDERVPFATAVNGACGNLPVDAELRQELLEIDDVRLRQQRVLHLTDEVLKRLVALRKNEDDESPLN
jgi:Lon protease-like protein